MATVPLTNEVYLTRCIAVAIDYEQSGDPTESLSRYQARLEAHHYGNMEEVRFLWDGIMGRHGKEAQYWMEYSQLERCGVVWCVRVSGCMWVCTLYVYVGVYTVCVSAGVFGWGVHAYVCVHVCLQV